MTPAFWKEKRVFITGHTGFKGAWLTLWLQSLGAKVTGYALPPPTQPNLFTLTRLLPLIEHIENDVRDQPYLTAAMQAAQPDIVLHLAAQSLVRESYQSPVETYATNVMGTVHVLEALRHTPSVKAAVIVSSDKCYANKEQIWGYREPNSMGGDDPYSSSKGCAELVTHAYRTSFMNEVHSPAIASARAGNVIGGGDWAKDRLIPDIIQSLISKTHVKLRYPNAIRPWQHVLEPLSGYLKLAECLFTSGTDYAEGWNFGPSDEDSISVEKMTRTLFQAWGEPANFTVENAQLHEAGVLKLDCTKARTRLNWEPQWSAQTAIKQVCDWYKAYLAGSDMHAYTLDQISQYQQTLTEKQSAATSLISKSL